MIANRDGDALYTSAAGTQEFRRVDVTANAFQFLGVQPLLGRSITPEDGMAGAPPVFAMSYTLWKQKFNGHPKIVGTSFTLNGEPRTLIGIMPPRFLYGMTTTFRVGACRFEPKRHDSTSITATWIRISGSWAA